MILKLNQNTNIHQGKKFKSSIKVCLFPHFFKLKEVNRHQNDHKMSKNEIQVQLVDHHLHNQQNRQNKVKKINLFKNPSRNFHKKTYLEEKPAKKDETVEVAHEIKATTVKR
jgi:hypothetical protein